MEVKDLRIGNYVFCDDKIHKVSSRDIYHVENTKLKLTPIPLTEEILFKCGLNQYVCGVKQENEFFHIFINYEFEYNIETKCMSIWSPSGYREGHNIIIKCEFVHQLQNLIFAVTGEELEINF